MTEFIGDFLVWVGIVAFPILATLPTSALICERAAIGARVLQGVIWLAATFTLCGAGLLFTHLAVDLPEISLTPAHANWAALTILTIGGGCARGTLAALADRLAATFEKIAKFFGAVAAPLVFAMAFVQFVVVFLRYVFGVNFIWMQESVTYMHGALFMLAAGAALIANEHVRVDIFYRDAPARRKALVDFLGAHLFLAPFCAAVIWTALPYVAGAWSPPEGSPEQSGIPAVFLLKTLIPVFAAVLACAGFAQARAAGRTLAGA